MIFVPISQLFRRLKGTSITASKMREISFDDGDICVYAGGKTRVYTTGDQIPNANIVDVPSVLIQSRGVIDALFCDGKYTFKNEFWAYSHDNIVTLRFLYHYLKTKLTFLRHEASKMGSIPQISHTDTDSILFPLIPFEEQERIVSILDCFDRLCSDSKDSISAEISARKKQYEYYRDKLLSFDRVEGGSVA